MELSRLRYSVLVALVVWGLWLALLGPDLGFGLVRENWPVTLTMVFGSLVAGATAEGGGAVAFPVFTKLLHIPPWDAKLFAIAIQSVGMTAASIVIVLLRIKVEWRAILWASIGGAVGTTFGAYHLAALLPPDVTKMTFTVLTSCFAVVLLLLNRRERRCHECIPADTRREQGLLVGMGFFGGVISSMVGTGLDIVVFSMLVLLFRVSEKIATPTSVIMQAINSLVGLVVYGGALQQLNGEVFGYWMAAIPVVVVGAPVGAILCALLSRQIIANVLVGLIFIELVSSLLIIPLRPGVVWFSLGTTAICLSLYSVMLRSRRYEPAFLPQAA